MGGIVVVDERVRAGGSEPTLRLMWKSFSDLRFVWDQHDAIRVEVLRGQNRYAKEIAFGIYEKGKLLKTRSLTTWRDIEAFEAAETELFLLHPELEPKPLRPL